MTEKLIYLSLVSLARGFLSVHVSTQTDDAKPFVDRWEYWKGNSQIQLEIDLCDTPTNGSYGAYNVLEGGYGLAYDIVDAYHIDDVEALTAVEGSVGGQKAEFKYSPTTKELSFLPPGSEPVVFRQKDKCSYVFISGGDKINVRSTPVSGSPLMKASREQSLRFLGKEEGWFEVELSAQDKRIGYISPEYAFYSRGNTILESAFTRGYANSLVSLTLEKKGEQVSMVKTTMYPPQSENIPMSSVEPYIGKVEGSVLIFTYLSGMPTRNINEMSKVKPYVVYYWKESGMFIMGGENYATDM